jgi:hypothetical protein
MASWNRRFIVAAVVLPLLFLAMPGMSRANTLIVNTLDGESQPFPLCTLPDAVAAHNIPGIVNGCGPASGTDLIIFAVTGTIFIDEPLQITNGSLTISGPLFGCSGPGPCGITIDGGGTVQIILADPTTSVFLNELTLADGFAPPASSGGGAIFANGTDLEINNCLLVNNKSAGPTTPDFGGLGGAIFGKAGTIEIVNSTLANNTAVKSSPAGSEGGAIFSLGAALKITNSTISGNKEDFGAIVPGVASLKGTIIANNDDSNCIVNSPTDLGFNIEDDASCGFNPAISKNNTNPLLDPLGLANNGGPTETIALQAMSPALDLIPVASCTDQQAIPQPLETDQRLFGRPDPANLNACDSGAYEVGAVAPIVLAPGTERLQIARNPTTANSDKVNIGLTFSYNGDPDCDLGPLGDEDALNDGFLIALSGGTCAALPNLQTSALFVFLDSFVVHTVNHQSYGTLFESLGSETVSARLVALPTPVGSCGEWTLNLEVAGLNTPALGLGGTNPFALIIDDLSDATQCFDVNNAIVGNQIPTPGHSVRRGVRRQTRR